MNLGDSRILESSLSLPQQRLLRQCARSVLLELEQDTPVFAKKDITMLLEMEMALANNVIQLALLALDHPLTLATNVLQAMDLMEPSVLNAIFLAVFATVLLPLNAMSALLDNFCSIVRLAKILVFVFRL